jgi:hypothetical protein
VRTSAFHHDRTLAGGRRRSANAQLRTFTGHGILSLKAAKDAGVPIASSWSDVLFLLVVAVIVFGATALAVYLFGRRIATRSRALAVFICGMAVPILIVGLAVVLLTTAPQGPPPNDGPAMLFMALVTLALLSCVVSVPASVLLIRRPN